MRDVCTLTLVALAACGGEIAGVSGDASSDAPWDAGPVDEAGYTRCATPEGWGICGPATGCEASPNRPGCESCVCPIDKSPACVPDNPAGGVGICDNLLSELTSPGLGASFCSDGLVQYNWLFATTTNGPDLHCAPYSVGLLLSRYLTDKDRLRYSDNGFFTSAPLPTPTDCPAFADFQICGGVCGPCGKGQTCGGRSPLHPYSFCIDDATTRWCSLSALDGGGKCATGGMTACFTFTVEPDAQAISDRSGVCLPLAQCQALAAKLPGGGTCTPD